MSTITLQGNKPDVTLLNLLYFNSMTTFTLSQQKIKVFCHMHYIVNFTAWTSLPLILLNLLLNNHN